MTSNTQAQQLERDISLVNVDILEQTLSDTDIQELLKQPFEHLCIADTFKDYLDTKKYPSLASGGVIPTTGADQTLDRLASQLRSAAGGLAAFHNGHAVFLHPRNVPQWTAGRTQAQSPADLRFLILKMAHLPHSGQVASVRENTGQITSIAEMAKLDIEHLFRWHDGNPLEHQAIIIDPANGELQEDAIRQLQQHGVTVYKASTPGSWDQYKKIIHERDNGGVVLVCWRLTIPYIAELTNIGIV